MCANRGHLALQVGEVEPIMSETTTTTEETPRGKFYYRDRYPVSHENKCQSRICMEARVENRSHTRDRYRLFRYCRQCDTQHKKTEIYCPCCKFRLRISSKFNRARRNEIKRID